MADLPRPDVSVTRGTTEGSGEHTYDVVISRGSRAKSYKGEGSTTEKAVENVVRKIIDTRDSLEWLP